MNSLLAEGTYLVVRRFGHVSVYQVVSQVSGSFRSDLVRVLNVPIGQSCLARRAQMLLEHKLPPARRGRLMWLALLSGKLPAALDWLLGRPKLCVVTTYESAVQKADELEFDPIEFTCKMTKWLPRRARVWAIMFVQLVIDTFFPFYGMKRLLNEM